MVIPDFKTPDSPKDESVRFRAKDLALLSRPLDRIGASIVDIFIVLMPIYLLLSAPLKSELTTSFLLGSETGIALYVLAQVFLTLGLVTFYQGYMHSRFGATVGKLIFHLRVRSIWGHGLPPFSTASKRAMVWCTEFLLLGIPMLGIFTDRQRRILHDRICDTEVVSLKDHSVRPPDLLERRAVHGFLGLLVLIFTTSMVASVVQGMQHVDKDKVLGSLLGGEKKCEEVSRALVTLGEHQADSTPTRLQVAMSLYAAGLVEKSCLADESEQDLDVNFTSSPINYLAKAFVYSDDADVSDSYLQEVCNQGPGSAECSMSELVSKWSEEDWQGVDEVIKMAPSGSTYLEVWAIRHYMKQGSVARALGFIEKISPNRILAPFLQSHRVKALWGLHREVEAEIAAIQSMDYLSKPEQISLSSWVCLEGLASSCSAAKRSACGLVQKNMPKDGLETAEATLGLAQLKIQECEAQDKVGYGVDYIRMASDSQDEGWKTFLKASSKGAKNDHDSAAALFADVVKSREAADELRLEAMRRFLRLAKIQDIEMLVTSWQEMKSGELWRKSGELLLNGLVYREQNDIAKKVAQLLESPNTIGIRSPASQDSQ